MPWTSLTASGTQGSGDLVAGIGGPAGRPLYVYVKVKYSDAMTECYSITDLAREFDVTTRTIRFYEDEGLLRPERQGQARIYRPRDRIRLKLILRGKRLGFSLKEVAEIIVVAYAETTKQPIKVSKSRAVGAYGPAVRYVRACLNALVQNFPELEDLIGKPTDEALAHRIRTAKKMLADPSPKKN